MCSRLSFCRRICRERKDQSRPRDRRGKNLSRRMGTAFSAARIAARVAALGKEVSREYNGRRVDVVVTLDRGFVFAADLMRQIDAPAVCYLVRGDVRGFEPCGD